MSSRTCPDWPELMELAPELQFKHYTVAEAQLPADALMQVTDVALSDVAICCDLDKNVFYAAHTDPSVAEALPQAHWFEVREWIAPAAPARRTSPRRPAVPEMGVTPQTSVCQLAESLSTSVSPAPRTIRAPHGPNET